MPKARKITRRTPPSPPAPHVPATAADRLLGDVRSLIQAAREQTARAVNSALVGLYWNIGTRIRQDILQEKQAGYGEQIVDSLSTQLSAEYGRGFGRRSLFRVIQFAESFLDQRIVSALSAQFESASSPPDPALEFLENVEAKIETEPGKEFPGGQGGQFAGACDQFGLGSFPHMFPGRQGDPVFTA